MIPYGALQTVGFQDTYRENQLTLQNLGCSTGLNPWVANDSPSRVVMLGSHLSQMLVVEGATPRRNKTGAEHNYAQNTWKVAMPVTGKVLKIVHKFPRTFGAGGFKINSETIVIYENLDSRSEGRMQLGMLVLKSHHCIHQAFGFKFKQVDTSKAFLSVGEIIPKGTIFSQSPNVLANGDYSYGIETNVAYMSIPQIIEDGFVISEGYRQKLATTAITSRMVSWGKSRYPLNLYAREGDPTYRPFPEIGDRVRADGLLFALRAYDPVLSAVEMTPDALRTPDEVFDKLVYAPPGAEVINVKIMHDPNQSMPPTPIGMDTLVHRYNNAQQTYSAQIADFYRDWKRRNPTTELTPELHNMIVGCMADNPKQSTHNVVLTHRATPLDDWTIEITLAHRVVPTIGFKLTDTHGKHTLH